MYICIYIFFCGLFVLLIVLLLVYFDHLFYFVKIFRFKVVIRVVDPTGTVSLILFDKDVCRLVGKTSAEILSDLDEVYLRFLNFNIYVYIFNYFKFFVNNYIFCVLIRVKWMMISHLS